MGLQRLPRRNSYPELCSPTSVQNTFSPKILLCKFTQTGKCWNMLQLELEVSWLEALRTSCLRLLRPLDTQAVWPTQMNPPQHNHSIIKDDLLQAWREPGKAEGHWFPCHKKTFPPLPCTWYSFFLKESFIQFVKTHHFWHCSNYLLMLTVTVFPIIKMFLYWPAVSCENMKCFFCCKKWDGSILKCFCVRNREGEIWKVFCEMFCVRNGTGGHLVLWELLSAENAGLVKYEPLCACPAPQKYISFL